VRLQRERAELPPRAALASLVLVPLALAPQAGAPLRDLELPLAKWQAAVRWQHRKIPRLAPSRGAPAAEVKFDPDIDFVFYPVDNDDLAKVDRIGLLRKIRVGSQDRAFDGPDRLL
jgi:hypothetical protein